MTPNPSLFAVSGFIRVHLRRLIATHSFVLALAVLLLPLSGCEQHLEPPIHDPKETTIRSHVVWADISLPPISTFEKACAHCHGRAGALFLRPFHHRGDALKVIVEEMMIGPAQLSPSPSDIDAMVSYHQAIVLDKPYVIITNAQSFMAGATSTLRGQVSQGASVRIVADDNIVPVACDGVDWYLENAPSPPLRVEAESQDGISLIHLE